MSAWARRRANVKLSDAGLALGRFGQRAKPVKPGVILALSLSNFCPDVKELESQASLQHAVEGLRGVWRQAKSAAEHCDSVLRGYVLCREVTASKNSRKNTACGKAALHERRESLKTRVLPAGAIERAPRALTGKPYRERSSGDPHARIGSKIQAERRTFCAHYAASDG